MSSGDIICVLLSGPTPYVLRPNLSGTAYIFIGECYVHGLMNAEALDMRDQGIIGQENFIIE